MFVDQYFNNDVIHRCTAIPTYHGCFADDNEQRDLFGFSSDTSNLTIDICYESCFKRKYRFMGVQVS